MDQIYPGALKKPEPKTKGIFLTDILQVGLDVNNASNKEIIIQKIIFSNISDDESVKFDMYLWMGNEQKAIYLAKDFSLGTSQSYYYYGINLLPGDELKFKSNISGAVSVIISYSVTEILPLYENIIPARYNRYGEILTTSENKICECPLDTEIIIHDGLIINKTNAEDVKVDLKLKKNGGDSFNFFSKNLFIPSYTSYSVDSINLESGDSIWAVCNKINSADILLNTLNTMLISPQIP